jgi:hypothetical protein
MAHAAVVKAQFEGLGAGIVREAPSLRSLASKGSM